MMPKSSSQIFDEICAGWNERSGFINDAAVNRSTHNRPSFATVSGHRPNITCDNQTMRSRFLPVLSIFAGGLVYTVLPHDAFGAYDVASRAAVTGAVAGVTCLLVLTLSKRWRRSH